jgi:hypothetical protein
MKSRVTPTIYIEFKPSKEILGCYACISIACLACLLLVHILYWLKITLILLVLIVTVYVMMRDILLLLPCSWKSLEVNSKGEILLTTRKQQVHQAMPNASTVNFVSLTVLNFKRTSLALGWRSSCWMTPCQVHDANQYRKLRVWLRWGLPSAMDVEKLR